MYLHSRVWGLVGFYSQKNELLFLEAGDGHVKQVMAISERQEFSLIFRQLGFFKQVWTQLRRP